MGAGNSDKNPEVEVAGLHPEAVEGGAEGVDDTLHGLSQMFLVNMCRQLTNISFFFVEKICAFLLGKF